MAGLSPRRYPLGMQTFSELREQDYVYVDKTRYIWQLAHGGGKAFFLSRPRRFGKSLLLSTMQSYFEGRRSLFDGLAAGALEESWEAYPVIRLDLSTVKTIDVAGLNSLLGSLMGALERNFGFERQDEHAGARLRTLINRVRDAAGKPVVILVDEYDAPLLNVVDDPDRLEAFRQVMREFYIPLKACDGDLRFVFITGITKFSQLSIFSELNNLVNISMMPEYAGICGITEQELKDQLSPDIEVLARRIDRSVDETFAQLKRYYDGYRFCSPSPDIYNPFSLLGAFFYGRIESFWFGSGTPTALINMIRAHGWQISDLLEQDVLDSEFDAPAEAMDTPFALFYQAGYLTIKRCDPEAHVYTLGIPNEEVSRGLSEGLVRHAAQGALRSHNAFLIKLARQLRAGDVEGALQNMRSYLAGIPYHLGSRDERGFETTFYLIFDLLGIQIDTEFRTATGRINAVVRAPGATYVMEFKYGRSAAEALAQIDEKDYALPFSADKGRVVKVGVNFSPDAQTIDDWVIEEVND